MRDNILDNDSINIILDNMSISDIENLSRTNRKFRRLGNDKIRIIKRNLANMLNVQISDIDDLNENFDLLIGYAQNKEIQKVKIILKYFPEHRDADDDEANTLIIIAVNTQNIELAKFLLKDDLVPLNRRNDYGETPLIRASFHAINNAQLVKMLLDAGADPDIQDELGQTALMKAGYTGNIEIVKRLLNAGADPNIQDENGSTVLFDVINRGHVKVLKLLLRKGINPNIEDNNNRTALMMADYRGNDEFLEKRDEIIKSIVQQPQIKKKTKKTKKRQTKQRKKSKRRKRRNKLKKEKRKFKMDQVDDNEIMINLPPTYTPYQAPDPPYVRPPVEPMNDIVALQNRVRDLDNLLEGTQTSCDRRIKELKKLNDKLKQQVLVEKNKFRNISGNIQQKASQLAQEKCNDLLTSNKQLQDQLRSLHKSMNNVLEEFEQNQRKKLIIYDQRIYNLMMNIMYVFKIDKKNPNGQREFEESLNSEQMAFRRNYIREIRDIREFLMRQYD